MKKSLLLASVAASLFVSQADAMELKPYVGLDYSYSKASTNDIIVEQALVPSKLYEDTYNSVVVSVGTKLHQNFGLEAFYQKSGEEKGTQAVFVSGGSPIATDKIETSFDAYGLDAQGYLSVAKGIELIGSLGLAQYDFEMKGFGKKASDDKIGYRLGAGAQYNFNENFAIRGMARYIILDSDAVDDMTEFTLGLRYTF